MGMSLWVWVENMDHGVETYWLSSKVKVPGAAVSKKVLLMVFWDMKVLLISLKKV